LSGGKRKWEETKAKSKWPCQARGEAKGDGQGKACSRRFGTSKKKRKFTASTLLQKNKYKKDRAGVTRGHRKGWKNCHSRDVVVSPREKRNSYSRTHMGSAE